MNLKYLICLFKGHAEKQVGKSEDGDIELFQCDRCKKRRSVSFSKGHWQIHSSPIFGWRHSFYTPTEPILEYWNLLFIQVYHFLPLNVTEEVGDKMIDQETLNKIDELIDEIRKYKEGVTYLDKEYCAVKIASLCAELDIGKMLLVHGKEYYEDICHLTSKKTNS